MQIGGVLTLAIYVSSLYFICAVVFIYGLIKWYQFQNHFLITKRFPSITNLIIFVSFISQITIIIREWVDYSQNGENRSYSNNHMLFMVIQGTPHSASFCLSALLIYRVMLIYLRYNAYNQATTLSISRSKAQVQIQIHSNTELQLTSSPTTIPMYTNNFISHKLSIIFYVYITICFIFIEICHFNRDIIMLVSIPWTTLIIFGICIIILVKCKKVKEGIKCLHESYSTLIYITICVMLAMIGTPNRFILWLNLCSVPFQSLLPLYLSLYYIYKCEGTLNAKIWQTKYQSQAKMNLDVDIDDIDDIDIVMDQSEDNNDNDINFDVTVFMFLNNIKNYEIFASYLGYCFAIENLLFVQNVSVFYQVMQKRLNSDEIIVNCEIYRAKFEYLNDLYNTYENKLCKMDDNNYHDVLYDVCYAIFSEFIQSGAVHEINIPYSCRMNLTRLLSDKKNMDQFKSVNNFVVLFDVALLEIYSLLASLYSYSLVEYYRNHYQ